MSKPEADLDERSFTIHEVDSDYEPTVSKSLDFYAPESKPFMRQALKRAVECGEPFDLELRFITAKRNHLWVHSISEGISAEWENHQGIRDISGHHRAYAAEEKSGRFLPNRKLFSIMQRWGLLL